MACVAIKLGGIDAFKISRLVREDELRLQNSMYELRGEGCKCPSA